MGIRSWLVATGAALVAGVLSVTFPGVSGAQVHGGHVHEEEYEIDEPPPGERHDRRWRVELGGGLAVSVPQGEFAQFVDEGYGLALHTTVGLDRSNILALRLDGGFVTYGSERFSVPLLPTTGRVFVDLNTRNNIGFVGMGPQLQVPYGPVRPYVNGFVGLGYFFTASSVRGSSDFDGFARSVNFDDTSLAWGGGGGLSLRVARGRTPVFVNMEAQVRRHGLTDYLVEGSIVDDGFGGVFVEPLRTEADFLLVQLGVSVGL